MRTNVFHRYNLAGIQLRNRILRSATYEGLGDESGLPTPQLVQKYAHLAKGGIGGIITGELIVQRNGEGPFYGGLLIDRDECIRYYAAVVDAVHALKTPIIAQVNHCGRQTRSKITGEKPVAPSAIRDKYFTEETPKELTAGEIEEIIDSFVSAIIRVKSAGFDGVQLHMSHGYLLSEFLSPYMNRRTDEWGGSLENRFRIVAEILRRAKAAVKDFPILAKLNAYDNRKNGMRVEEAIEIARLLQEYGCVAIEVSCGVSEDKFFTIRNAANVADAVFQKSFKVEGIPSPLKPVVKFFIRKTFDPTPPICLYNLPAAQAVKAAVSIPVIAVGGIRSLDEVQDILDNEKADLVSLSRPLIVEPNLVAKFESGKQAESRCISCCYCALGIEHEPLRCYLGRIN